MYLSNRIRIITALFLAVIIVVLTYVFLNNSSGKCNIVVAVKNIESGVKIDESCVEEKSIPIDVKNTYFKDSTANKKDVLGCVAKLKIKKGEPVKLNSETLSMGKELISSLTSEGKINNSFFLSEDERLVAVEVDNSGSINYSLKKGDFVDVIFSSVDDNTGGLFSNMLLQHVEVYDLQRVVIEEGGIASKKQSVILKASPEQSMKLIAANRNGKIDLILNPLKGFKKDVEAVNVLSFSAYKPLTKEQKLKSLESYIKNFEMRDSVKENMLKALEQEKDKDAIIEFVNAATIEVDKKEKILQIIKGER